MTKQQLASKIWESANKMRSKIEANEYKDYILGFIFYKFLSEKEIKYLKENDWTDVDIPELKEEDSETRESIIKNLGYYISYDNLFSTWLNKGSDFSVSDVRDALNAFTRLITTSHTRVFDGIFDTLHTGLSKLGDSTASQSKAIRDLINLIKDIPMDGKQGYDVLGFIYEYLLEKFAANAGKKAGEFYTPHEVSVLMSELVANHLKDKGKIEIFDPTSGSGSLLINIGKSVSRYLEGENNIKYYAQELKRNTYNLTRMNLIMQGIAADNIVARNADTLEDDWPYFDENDKENTYNPLYVDAVVSNPPYSQPWDRDGKELDPRYAGYGLAPNKKADYAFLLHDLYHVKPDGIMTIVLPHGVLFRGGEEGQIRKNLIEKNKIDAIIGLPSNIFFGTGIPTIVMVLKQKKENTDVLIIDASKGFIKEGKNNKLRSSDIKKIVDTVVNRADISKFSRIVSRDEIRNNDYNLNIPRYVDSSENDEKWDIFAVMYGEIPISEINDLKEYWNTFSSLKESLFEKTSEEYARFSTDEIKKLIYAHKDVITFKDKFESAFSGFDAFLYHELISNKMDFSISKKEEIISLNIFERLNDTSLVDNYKAYQIFYDEWLNISVDLEIIQTEGFESTRVVDPNMVTKKKDGKEQEVQEGWRGRILPFELVQKHFLNDELLELKKEIDRISEISEEYTVLIDSLADDEKENLLNDDNSFKNKELGIAYKNIMDNISSEEISLLHKYLELPKGDKAKFVLEHNEINWGGMVKSKDGSYGKTEINKYIDTLKADFQFEEETYEYIVSKVNYLLFEEKALKKEVKEKEEILHRKTKDFIENLSEEEILTLLKDKWISPLISNLLKLPENILTDFIKRLEALSKKYETTLVDLERDIQKAETSLSILIDELEGDESDMLGLLEFKKLLGGE